MQAVTGCHAIATTVSIPVTHVTESAPLPFFRSPIHNKTLVNLAITEL
jgi:hypothetical protein